MAQVLTPASLRARLISWKVPPGMYGIRQYGLNSSGSDRSIPMKGRTSKRFSGMSLFVSFCLQLCLFLFVVCLLELDGGLYVAATCSRVTRLWPLSTKRFMMNLISSLI